MSLHDAPPLAATAVREAAGENDHAQRARPVVFLHTIKTGGTTFRGVLSTIYGEAFHNCEDPSIDAVAAALARFDCVELHTALRDGDFVHMHREAVAQGRWDLFEKAHVFTMLREPVDHAISLYYHMTEVRAYAEPAFQHSGVPFPESLEQFADLPRHLNTQTGFLVGRGSLGMTEMLDARDLEAAKDVLLRLHAHVGLMERFAESLHIFESVTGRRVPQGRIQNQNVNARRPPLSSVPASLRATIRDRSALDLELYDFARTLFEQDLAGRGRAPTYTFGGPSAPSPTMNAERHGSPSGVDPAVMGAIDFLAASQLPDGEFQTEFSLGPRGVDPSATEQLVFDSSPFITSVVLHSLEFGRSLHPAVPAMIERGCAFLRAEMDPGGLWRYWSKKNTTRAWIPAHLTPPWIPPDVDDTSCVSHVLRSNGVSVPDNRGLLYDTRDARGAFYTWMYKPNSLRKWKLWLRTRGKAFAYQSIIWQWTAKDDVCAVVNANAVLYLGETPETRGAIDYLRAVIRNATEATDIVFYAHPLSLYYMMSRAYRGGASSLGDVSPLIVKRIAALREADGGYGNALHTAFAICALLNLGAPPDGLEASMATLVRQQRPDGSWERIAAYGGPPDPTTFGSADLTTALCLEALVRSAAAIGVAPSLARR